MLLQSKNREIQVNHAIEGSKVNTTSASRTKILLPYDADSILNDTKAILLDLVAENAAKSGNSHHLAALQPDGADVDTVLDSVEFYIGVNVQPPNIQERYKRENNGVEACRLMLYVDIKTKWNTKSIRYQIPTKSQIAEAEALVLLFEVDGRRGLDTERSAVYGEWIQNLFKTPMPPTAEPQNAMEMTWGETSHEIDRTKIDYTSARGSEILLPCNAPMDDKDVQQIIFEAVALCDPPPHLCTDHEPNTPHEKRNYDSTAAIGEKVKREFSASDLPAMVESVQFYIKLTAHDAITTQAYRQGKTKLQPCFMQVFVAIKTKWSEAAQMYQVGANWTQKDVDEVAANFQRKRRRGLDPAEKKMYFHRLREWLQGGEVAITTTAQQHETDKRQGQKPPPLLFWGGGGFTFWGNHGTAARRIVSFFYRPDVSSYDRASLSTSCSEKI